MQRSKKATRRVRRAYSQQALARTCVMPEREFGAAYGMETVAADAKQPFDFYHFKDNGSGVLAVAHLDTVVRASQRAARFSNTRYGPLVRSGALDDRLGAYVILELLPALGVTFDWLLTTGEETGMSTAQFFEPSKEYDWVIEFDRGGTDVVMYDYETRQAREAVQACGAVVGQGSFTDICYLEHLGVKAFNWGVGYRDYHSTRGHAYLSETFAMVGQFLKFHEANAGTTMPHEPRDPWAWDDYGEGRTRPWERESGLDCLFCHGWGTVNDVTLYCRECKLCQECGDYELDCLCYVPEHLREKLAPGRESDYRNYDDCNADDEGAVATAATLNELGY